MIKVFAVGNIGKDAELKTINDNTSVTTFSIASTKKVKGEDVTTWLTCKKWNSDKLTPYLTKGTKVIVSGELEIREYEGKYYTSLNVWDLEFGSKVSQNETSFTKQEAALPNYEEKKEETYRTDAPPPEQSDLPF